MYEKLYGLSCVENQVLAILRNNGVPISYLYHDSAVPVKILYEHVVNYGEKPAYFTGIPRIQDTLKSMGLITLTLTRSGDLHRLIKCCNACESNQNIFVQCNPSFTKDVLNARGLREDHFVWLKKENNVFFLYNDIPDKKVEINILKDDFYGGAFFTLIQQKNFTEQDGAFLFQSRRYTPGDVSKCPNLVVTKGTALRLRNFAGVLKTIRYRMKAYYGNFCDTGFLDSYLSKLEKQYAVLEYYNLRNMQDRTKYSRIVADMLREDMAAMQELKIKLEEKVNG